jgi:hypothetical protein
MFKYSAGLKTEEVSNYLELTKMKVRNHRACALDKNCCSFLELMEFCADSD